MNNEIKALASSLLPLFESKQRKDNEQYYCFTLGAITSKDPKSVMISDVVHALSENMDTDTVYRGVHNALEYIDITSETSDFQHLSAEYADTQVDIYNSDLAEWLAQSNHNGYLVNEALENSSLDASPHGFCVYEAIKHGQYKAYQDCYNAVMEALTSFVEANKQ